MRTSCLVPGWSRSWPWPSEPAWVILSPSTSGSRARPVRTRTSRSAPWSRGWSPGPTASRTWTSCVTEGWTGCWCRRGHRRRWALICGVHVWPRAPARRGRLPVLGGARRGGPGAGRGRPGRLSRHRRHDPCHPRVQEAGRRLRVLGVKGLDAVVATISTPTATPVIAATRLRRANVNSAKGAPRLVADALVTAKNEPSRVPCRSQTRCGSGWRAVVAA